MILTQDFGQGKVVAIFSDSLWKWQLSADALKNNPYPRFWHQLLSWLSPKADKIEGKSWDVFLDRETCFLNEEIEVTARWIGEGTPEAGTSVNAEVVLPDKRKVPFVMASQTDQMLAGKVVSAFSVKVKGEVAGMYSVSVTSGEGSHRLESELAFFSVKPYSPESIPRPPDATTLKAITANSEGAYFELSGDLDRVLSSITPKKLEQSVSEFKTYWQHWLMLTFLITLIAVEWIIRKFRNLT